ncbi:DUF1737 domain-containing protein [Xanthomonas arboricola]|uniref:DUF1737 domain-containing protein n=1 Tax=Xanthomonas arboricola TaxID=56448 RepID=UPI0011B05622|nr:DUF1737 domain-containing protein [Xanthomonas arboricola]
MAINQRPISKYTVELAPSKDALVKKINERVGAGWELQGPLSIKYPKNALFPMYGQALVWRKASEPPAPSASNGGCLGIIFLFGCLPPAAMMAVHLI